MSRHAAPISRSWLIGMVTLCLVGLWLGHYLPVFLFLPAPPPVKPPAAVAPRVTVERPTPDSAIGPLATRTPAEASVAIYTPAATTKAITLTVVYDNLPLDPRLQTAWGFACLVETAEMTILFDTGSDGSLLLENMSILGQDPRDVDAVVLSHIHRDHIGGLEALAAVNPWATVYLPRSFPAEFKASLRNPMIAVSDPMTITAQVRTTGELGQALREQALIVQMEEGLIVVTGCAHPGIVEIVRQARAYGEVELVVGGFHLESQSVGEVDAMIATLQQLGVRRIAPCHCTGAQAIELFAAAFGSSYLPVGVGLQLIFAE